MSPKTYYLKNIYNYMTVYSILEAILFDTVTYPLRIGIVVGRQLQHLPGSGLTLGSSS
jgi:hypothetical protein